MAKPKKDLKSIKSKGDTTINTELISADKMNDIGINIDINVISEKVKELEENNALILKMVKEMYYRAGVSN